jgi:hypothetical protein
MPVQQVPRPYRLKPSLPPETEVKEKGNWHYDRCPQEIEHFIIDEAFIVQLLEPGHIFIDNAWLKLFPQKLKSGLQYESQERTIAWGDHIVEGRNEAPIAWLALLIVVASGFGIIYTTLSRDSPTASNIAAFLGTASGLSVTYLQFQRGNTG